MRQSDSGSRMLSTAFFRPSLPPFDDWIAVRILAVFAPATSPVLLLLLITHASPDRAKARRPPSAVDFGNLEKEKPFRALAMPGLCHASPGHAPPTLNLFERTLLKDELAVARSPIPDAKRSCYMKVLNYLSSI